jgi:beta-xylosidase
VEEGLAKSHSFKVLLAYAVLLASSVVSICQKPIRDNLRLEEVPAHDPWVVADRKNNTYYLYVNSDPSYSGDHRCGVVTYRSKDLATWSGPYLVFEVPTNSWANPIQGVWAPEVHFYNGKYYLFATLNNYDKALPFEGSQETDPAAHQVHIHITYLGTGPHLRGTQVFVSDSPEGPFKVIADRPIPPFDYMTLDGTFYVENGTPYMIYAHEWQQLWDGAMEAVQMKADLSGSVGKPFYLFKASDAPWLAGPHDTFNTPQNYVTDGPELYRTRTEKLLRTR